MNDGRLSAATRALLAKARADAPSGAARAKIWSGVSSMVGGAAGPSSAAGAGGGPTSSASLTVAGGAGALKTFAIGALLGGAVTVGLGAMALRIGSSGGFSVLGGGHQAGTPSALVAAGSQRSASASSLSSATVSPGLRFVVPEEGATGPEATPRPPRAGGGPELAVAGANPLPARVQGYLLGPGAPSTASAPDALPSVSPARAPKFAPAAARPTGGPRLDPSDALAREASLLAEARAALVRGDALSALREARGARSLPTRQLVPEELAVEAQALRALGREREATKLDKALRFQYPESDLAR